MKFGPFLTPEAYLAHLQRKKIEEASLPQPADQVPKSEAVSGATGSKTKNYALEDHQHPRLTSTTYATLGANGQATVMFSRTFTNKPGLNLTETDASPQTNVLALRSLNWMMQEGRFAGVVIEGKRALALPILNPVSGLLGAVTTGVNVVVNALSGYNVFSGSGAGATVSIIAVARSDVASG